MGTLKPLPPTFAETREALHKVAEAIVSAARKPHNEIALTVTPGGFGTPPFDHDGRRLQVRVEGGELVVDSDSPGASADTETRAPLRSLAQAGAVVGAELLPDGLPDDHQDLYVDAEAAERLGEFYAFAAEALEAFKSGLPEDADASDVNLWPEHFDVAFEAGSEAEGKRANYGASPGDEHHPEPYLYVGPWSGEAEGELWNASGFTGAELGYAELLDVEDPAARALDFFESRYRALDG